MMESEFNLDVTKHVNEVKNLKKESNEFFSESYSKNFNNIKDIDNLESFDNGKIGMINNLGITQIMSNMDSSNSPHFYATTTASSIDQIMDYSNPAFPIKEDDNIKQNRLVCDKKSEIKITELKTINETPENNINNNFFEEKLDISKYNSLIKEDKEKRKVIVEWYNNNELCTKQWSCKKFGKEGAAKRAIQFLEKIHGITINCIKNGFYSTLLEIGCLDKKVDCKKNSTEKIKEKRKYKKKKIDNILENENSCNFTNESTQFEKNNNKFEDCNNLIQKMLLFFISLDDKIFEYDIENEKKIEKDLHSNCRKIIRKLIQDNMNHKKFFLSDYISLFNPHKLDTDYGISKVEDENKIKNSFLIEKEYNKNGYNSLSAVKTVKEILHKTVRDDLQILYAIEDIIKIINLNENLSLKNEDDKNIGIDKKLWDNLIEDESRINDDLHYLSEGGFPGYTSVTSSTYGNGYFRFKRNSISNINFGSISKWINHENSCLNSMHIEIQKNGLKAIPNVEKRTTRLQGRNNENNDINKFNKNQISILNKPNINDENINISNINNLEMENAIFILLDMKYKIKGGQSKQALSDIININKNQIYINDISIINSKKIDKNNEKKKYKKRKVMDTSFVNVNTIKNSNLSDELEQIKFTKKNNIAHSMNLENDLGNSTIEWWRKPRGWKVCYYKGKQKYSQIFRVSLNSSYSERESQYKLAYSFFLSTQNKDFLKDENNNISNEQNVPIQKQINNFIEKNENLIHKCNNFQNQNEFNNNNLILNKNYDNYLNVNSVNRMGFPNYLNTSQLFNSFNIPSGIAFNNGIPLNFVLPCFSYPYTFGIINSTTQAPLYNPQLINQIPFTSNIHRNIFSNINTNNNYYYNCNNLNINNS